MIFIDAKFKSRYTIDAKSIEVQGNRLDMEFQVKQNGEIGG